MTDTPIRCAHLALALNISERALNMHLLRGNLPQPDARGLSGVKLWRLSTIRAWNPAVAADIEQILAIPAFAPRPQRRCNTPLLPRWNRTAANRPPLALATLLTARCMKLITTATNPA